MNRKLVVALVGLSAFFFLVSLAVFLRTGRGASGYEPEVVNKVADDRSEVVEFLKVRLFFLTEDSPLLQPVSRDIEIPAVREELYRRFVELLIAGAPGFVAPVPEGTKLRAVHFLPAASMLALDFQDSLLGLFPGGTAAECEFVYFLVNNLCVNFPEIKKVKFLLGGNEIRTLSGHLDLERPFYPDLSLLQP